MSSFDFIGKPNQPTLRRSSFTAFKAMLDKAIADKNQGLFEYLEENFAVCNHCVSFIGFGSLLHNCRPLSKWHTANSKEDVQK